MFSNCGAREDSWESFGLQGEPTTQSYRKSVLNIHWKDWCWSSNTLSTWCEELTHWKRPWCWERLRAGGEGDDRVSDGWMASPTQWTWVWISSGSWWWTGKPGVLQSMGSQRVGHDWVTELTCTLTCWHKCVHMCTYEHIQSSVVPWNKNHIPHYSLQGPVWSVPSLPLPITNQLWLHLPSFCSWNVSSCPQTYDRQTCCYYCCYLESLSPILLSHPSSLNPNGASSDRPSPACNVLHHTFHFQEIVSSLFSHASWVLALSMTDLSHFRFYCAILESHCSKIAT